jgi:hypothetical protein
MLADKLGGSNPFHSLEARRNVVRQLQVMTSRRRLARGADYPGSPITARARTHSWTSASSQATACVESRLADLEPRSWKELRERGAPRVVLWTAERNDVAQRLVDRLGFRRR